MPTIIDKFDDKLLCSSRFAKWYRQYLHDIVALILNEWLFETIESENFDMVKWPRITGNKSSFYYYIQNEKHKQNIS